MGKKASSADKAARLARALRDNLRRRKADGGTEEGAGVRRRSDPLKPRPDKPTQADEDGPAQEGPAHKGPVQEG